MSGRLGRLADLVASIATELGCLCPGAGALIHERGDAVVVTVDGEDTALDPGDRLLPLLVEHIIHRMESLGERRRLQAAVQAAGCDVDAPWLVHTNRFVRDWLIWNGGGHGSADWRADRTIRARAAATGERLVAVPNRHSNSGLPVTLSVTRRRVWCQLPLLSGATYSAAASDIELAGPLPETIVTALEGRNDGSNRTLLLGDHFEMSGGVGTMTPISVSNKGGHARIRLADDVVPLAPIPGKAFSAVASPGPAHAPWRIADDAWQRVHELSRRVCGL